MVRVTSLPTSKCRSTKFPTLSRSTPRECVRECVPCLLLMSDLCRVRRQAGMEEEKRRGGVGGGGGGVSDDQ